MIEQVVHLPSEIQRLPLLDPKSLHQREVVVEVNRTAKSIASGRADSPAPGKRSPVQFAHVVSGLAVP